ARRSIHPGGEFDWYASDSAGHVAMFSTAGFGWVPTAVFRSPSDYLHVHEYFRNASPSTTARLMRKDAPIERPVWKRALDLLRTNYGAVPPLRPCYDDWLEMAARGLFTYDFDYGADAPAIYRILALPAEPLHLEILPESIRQWLIGIQFPGNFLELTTCDPR